MAEPYGSITDLENWGGWSAENQAYAIQPTVASQTSGLAGNFAGFGNGLKNAWGSLFGNNTGSLDAGGMQNAGGAMGKTAGSGMGLADGLALGTKAIGAIGGIMDARLGKKKLKLAEEQFGFQKAAANRDVANQAQLVNNQIQNAGEVGMGLAGNTMDTAARAARQAQMNTMKVNGSPIG